MNPYLEDDLPVIVVEEAGGAPAGLVAMRVRMPDGYRTLVLVKRAAAERGDVEVAVTAAAALWPAHGMRRAAIG